MGGRLSLPPFNPGRDGKIARPLTILIVLAALAFLMVVAYRGFSVILFAPVAALLAVLVTDPAAVAPMFAGVFMERMVAFLELYFPVFLLGAVFGKIIELAGFARSIVASLIRITGRNTPCCRSSSSPPC